MKNAQENISTLYEAHAELDELSDYLQSIERQSARISETLIPFYLHRRQLKNCINQTHRGMWHANRDEQIEFVVTGWRRSNERAAMFMDWDQLHRKYAPDVEEKRILTRKAMELSRRIGGLKKLILKLKTIERGP